MKENGTKDAARERHRSMFSSLELCHDIRHRQSVGIILSPQGRKKKEGKEEKVEEEGKEEDDHEGEEGVKGGEGVEE